MAPPITPKTPWYRRGFSIVVLLIVFPPAGAVLACLYMLGWPKPVRYMLAAWGALWALYYVYVVVYVIITILALAAQATTQAAPTQAVVETAPTSAPALPPLAPPPSSAPPLAAPIEPTPVPAPPSAPAPVRLVVRGTGAAGVSLRTTPGTGDRLKLLKDGDELTAMGEEQQATGRSWQRVKDADGTEGWVASEFVIASIAPAP